MLDLLLSFKGSILHIFPCHKQLSAQIMLAGRSMASLHVHSTSNQSFTFLKMYVRTFSFRMSSYAQGMRMFITNAPNSQALVTT